MTDVPETKLLDRFREGDTRAFAELVRRHQGALLRHARSLLGAGSSCEDVVQDAFLKLAQQPPALPTEPEGDSRPERAQLASWLHTVTRNLCMDALRSDTRRRQREERVAAPEASTGGLDAIEAADTRAVVERQLGALPQDQREVLILRLLGEKSYREIATITGRKIGTVGWLVSVGLKALSAQLAPVLQGIPKQREDRAVTEPRMGFGLVQGDLS